MATTVERTTVPSGKTEIRGTVAPSLSKLLAVVAIVLAGWAVVARSGAGGTAAAVLRPALALTWGLAGLALVVRRPTHWRDWSFPFSPPRGCTCCWLFPQGSSGRDRAVF
jgi:hypothetical protein